MGNNGERDIYTIAQKQVDYVKSILSKRFSFEDNNTNEVHGGYTTYGTLTTSDSIIVVRVSNHICSMDNWIERYKAKLLPNKKLARRMGKNLQDAYKERRFYSVVFKAFDYATNDNGAWNAVCFEYVFNPIEVLNGNQIGNIAKEVFSLSGQNKPICGVSPVVRRTITSKTNPTLQQTTNTENNQTIGMNTIVDNNGTTRSATKWTHGADDVVDESKTIRKMNKKQTIRLNENQLRRIVTESVKRVLKEGYTNSTGEYVPDEIDMDKGAFADYKAVHNFGQKERKNINPNRVLRDAISGLRKIAGELSYLSVNYEHEVDYDFQPTREQSDIARKVVGKVSALAREIEASGALVSNIH